MAKTSSKSVDSLDKFSWVVKMIEFKLGALEFLSPLANLGIRLWMADIFWTSGLLKLPKGFLWLGQGNWSSTLFLFEYEHPVPGFSPEMAAYMGTFFELLCPVLLFIGLGTRAAAFILLIMTAFIQITYQQHITHIYWMILLAVLILQGAGRISLDFRIRKLVLSSKRYMKLAGGK